MSPQPATPQQTVERALALSGADQTVVIATESSSANLRWAGNTLTTNGVTRSRDLTVVAVVGRAAGSVSRSGVTDDQLEDLVRAAESAARGNPEAEDYGELAADGADADWDAEPAVTSIGAFERLAPALGDAFGAARSAGHLLYGYAEHEAVTTYLGTSTGLRRRHDQPTGRFEVTGRTPGGERSAWTGQGSRDFADIDMAAHAAELDRRLAWASRAVDLPAGRYETLLPPSTVADLMTYMYWSAGARDAHDGRTVFSKPGGGTKVGERLTPQPLTLHSDPARGDIAAAPFVTAAASSRLSSVFDNGQPVSATEWIADGTLRALLQTRHSAQVTGLAFTPWVDNLVLESATPGGDLDAMVAGTERGLLLTCLWYIREVDPQVLLLTGLTRDGVFLVENGEVTGAVNNFRFNESPVSLLSRATEVGPAVRTLAREFGDYFTRTEMPALRVPDFNMSSVSQAS